VQVTGSVWLVTGAAGYVGSHVVRALCARGAQVVGLDDLSRGDPARLPPDVPLVVGSVHDSDLVALTLRHHHVDGVIHLAARKAVTESRERPLLYYNENVNGLVRLLEAMETASVTRLLFCSSAAVYGTPRVERVDEQAACAPLSPYGETKLAGEWLIRNQAAAVGLRYVVLRCFNVAGAASPKLVDRGATNVIPLVLRALAGGQAPQVFGADYATPDGTCVRDYVHVADIAEAHVASLALLSRAPGSGVVLNVGSGRGQSVREVLDCSREITGIDMAPRILSRRPGDPSRIVASLDQITRQTGWRPSCNLRDMIASCWDAHSR
jgi:UDP-glucose 4-epimerase